METTELEHINKLLDSDVELREVRYIYHLE